MLLRVFVVGSAGRADVGGPYDGREGRGIEAAIAETVTKGKRYRDNGVSTVFLRSSTVTLKI